MNFYVGDTHTCPHCHAPYKILEGGRSPYRDEDKENCAVCGEEMAKWNATWWPKFELLQER